MTTSHSPNGRHRSIAPCSANLRSYHLPSRTERMTVFAGYSWARSSLFQPGQPDDCDCERDSGCRGRGHHGDSGSGGEDRAGLAPTTGKYVARNSLIVAALLAERQSSPLPRCCRCADRDEGALTVPATVEPATDVLATTGWRERVVWPVVARVLTLIAIALAIGFVLRTPKPPQPMQAVRLSAEIGADASLYTSERPSAIFSPRRQATGSHCHRL